MKRVLHSLQIVYVRRFSFHSFVHLFVLEKQKKTTFIDNVEHLFEELQIMYAPWYCSHNMNWLLHRFQSSLLMDCLLSLSTSHWDRAEQGFVDICIMYAHLMFVILIALLLASIHAKRLVSSHWPFFLFFPQTHSEIYIILHEIIVCANIRYANLVFNSSKRTFLPMDFAQIHSRVNAAQ